MYDLDDEKEEEAIDITPDFMKHDEGDVDLEAADVDTSKDADAPDDADPGTLTDEGDEGESR
jgi:hypothetical protein